MPMPDMKVWNFTPSGDVFADIELVRMLIADMCEGHNFKAEGVEVILAAVEMAAKHGSDITRQTDRYTLRVLSAALYLELLSRGCPHDGERKQHE